MDLCCLAFAAANAPVTSRVRSEAPGGASLSVFVGIYARDEPHNSVPCAGARGGWLFAEDATTQSLSEWNTYLGDFDTPEA